MTITDPKRFSVAFGLHDMTGSKETIHNFCLQFNTQVKIQNMKFLETLFDFILLFHERHSV